MRILKPYMIAFAATLLITLAISWLPHSGGAPGKNRGDVAVFHPAAAKRLSNSNLVDMMVGLQLTGRLTKVDWDHAILSVEFKVKGEKEPSTEQWFDDMEKMVRLSFVQMENVNRLLIRFVAADVQQSGKPSLLFAADVRKTDSWLYDQIGYLNNADPLHDEVWKKRLRISFTSAWEEKYGRVNSYTAVPLTSS